MGRGPGVGPALAVADAEARRHAAAASYPRRMALRDELHEWRAGLPNWQQDLARRLAHATHLEGAALLRKTA